MPGLDPCKACAGVGDQLRVATSSPVGYAGSPDLASHGNGDSGWDTGSARRGGWGFRAFRCISAAHLSDATLPLATGMSSAMLPPQQPFCTDCGCGASTAMCPLPSRPLLHGVPHGPCPWGTASRCRHSAEEVWTTCSPRMIWYATSLRECPPEQRCDEWRYKM